MLNFYFAFIFGAEYRTRTCDLYLSGSALPTELNPQFSNRLVSFTVITALHSSEFRTESTPILLNRYSNSGVNQRQLAVESGQRSCQLLGLLQHSSFIQVDDNVLRAGAVLIR